MAHSIPWGYMLAVAAVMGFFVYMAFECTRSWNELRVLRKPLDKVMRKAKEAAEEAEAAFNAAKNARRSMSGDEGAKDEGPYRTAADQSHRGEEVDEKPAGPPDPRKDGFDRLRWRGEEEFYCQVCRGTKCKDPKFCVSNCKYKHKGEHLHVTCTKCEAVYSFGLAFAEQKYRSEVVKAPEPEPKKPKFDLSVGTDNILR